MAEIINMVEFLILEDDSPSLQSEGDYCSALSVMGWRANEKKLRQWAKRVFKVRKGSSLKRIADVTGKEGWVIYQLLKRR